MRVEIDVAELERRIKESDISGALNLVLDSIAVEIQYLDKLYDELGEPK